jgi:hypothetical protein
VYLNNATPDANKIVGGLVAKWEQTSPMQAYAVPLLMPTFWAIPWN